MIGQGWSWNYINACVGCIREYRPAAYKTEHLDQLRVAYLGSTISVG
jgi:hypothetical protein